MSHLIAEMEIENRRSTEEAEELLRLLRKLFEGLTESGRNQVREVIANALYAGRYSC